MNRPKEYKKDKQRIAELICYSYDEQVNLTYYKLIKR